LATPFLDGRNLHYGPLNISEREAERSIKAALRRGDIETAKSFVKVALGTTNDGRITELQALITKPNAQGGILSNSQKLEFLRQLDVDASEMMKTILEDPFCFTPDAGSRNFGHFWDLFKTRSYIRLLICVSWQAEAVEDYQLAYDCNLRILTYNTGDNTGTRSNFNLLQTKLGRDLEAFNYSVHLLEQHLDYAQVMKPFYGKNYPSIVLNKLKKEEIDPQDARVDPIRREIKYAEAAVLFTGTLALFKLFGPCPKANAWLAAGHARNSHVLPIFMHPESPSYPTTRFECTRAPGSYVEAAGLVIFTKRQFCTPEAQEWLNSAGADLPKRKCDCPGCGKLESYMGEWRRCTGCFGVYYCSEDCQKRHWAGQDGHKAPCKDAKNLRNMGF
jgi:hypothetical protein